MRRDVHWWSLSDPDLEAIGSFNWIATALFGIGSFCIGQAVNAACGLMLAENLGSERTISVAAVVWVTGILGAVFLVAGICFIIKKRTHVDRIKKASEAI